MCTASLSQANSWKRFIFTLWVFTHTTSGYNITRWFEESSSYYESRTDFPPWIESYEITLTASATPTTTITATTTSSYLYTVVDVVIPTGYGAQIRSDDRSAEYYVVLTYSTCIDKSGGGIVPVTLTHSLSFPPELTPYMIPTATVNGSRLLAPSDLHPIDLASASYDAIPTYLTTCSREVHTADYRSVCSSSASYSLARWSATRSSATASITTSTSTQSTVMPSSSGSLSLSEIQCGELNPCCHGCHGWGYGYYVVTSTSFYICEDGLQFNLNGTPRAPDDTIDWSRNDSDEADDSTRNSVVTSMAFGMLILSVVMIML